MYFSRYKQSMSQKFLVLVMLISLTVYLLTSIEWLLPVRCLIKGPFNTKGSCRTHVEDWNIFYHLGGNGPWIPMVPPYNLSADLPPACHVEQAHMLARHAERYPTKNAGSRHKYLLNKLKTPQSTLRGSLTFVKEWSYFAGTPNASFEDLTSSGPYAGTVQAQNAGAKFRRRYRDLIRTNSATKFWACSSPRDIETAKSFATGFFGRDWQNDGRAFLEIIPETPNRGANTLTPGDTCPRYQGDKIDGHDHGYAKLAQWQALFSRNIAARLKNDAGAPDLAPVEIYGMMELCGFEIMARGSSPWCDVFTHEEWLDFEYARDILHYYRAGAGNKYAGAMGWLWLNATMRLLKDDGVKDVFFSFVHDSDIVAAITALGLPSEASNTDRLPVDHNRHERSWKTSDIVPMGGYLVFEKVTCSGQSDPPNLEGSHIRLFINDALYSLENLVGGGGIAGSTTLALFSTPVLQRGEQSGKFEAVCGLMDGMPISIDFLHQ